MAAEQQCSVRAVCVSARCVHSVLYSVRYCIVGLFGGALWQRRTAQRTTQGQIAETASRANKTKVVCCSFVCCIIVALCVALMLLCVTLFAVLCGLVAVVSCCNVVWLCCVFVVSVYACLCLSRCLSLYVHALSLDGSRQHSSRVPFRQHSSRSSRAAEAAVQCNVRAALCSVLHCARIVCKALCSVACCIMRRAVLCIALHCACSLCVCVGLFGGTRSVKLEVEKGGRPQC